MGFHEMYEHHFEKFKELFQRMNVISPKGTVSEDEWEAIGKTFTCLFIQGLYMAVVFQKV